MSARRRAVRRLQHDHTEQVHLDVEDWRVSARGLAVRRLRHDHTEQVHMDVQDWRVSARRQTVSRLQHNMITWTRCILMLQIGASLGAVRRSGGSAGGAVAEGVAAQVAKNVFLIVIAVVALKELLIVGVDVK